MTERAGRERIRAGREHTSAREHASADVAPELFAVDDRLGRPDCDDASTGSG